MLSSNICTDKWDLSGGDQRVLLVSLNRDSMALFNAYACPGKLISGMTSTFLSLAC